MKLTEIQQPSDRTLFEEIDRENDTGFLTEDLVQIARAKQGTWSNTMTKSQLAEKIRKLNGNQV